MSQPAKHPPEQELLEFGLGKLPPGDSQRIEQHLEACPDCCQTVLVLQDDTFVGLVRTSKGKAPATVNADATVDIGIGAAARHAAAAELPAELRNHSRYEILGLIGRGGMGDVYQAQHRVMNRLVALKVIKPELVQNEAAVQRFRREVQAAARLHDRHIVTAYDAEQAGSLHFLVMEYVEGVNLDEVVRRRGALPVSEACDAIRQAACGLQHAHELGMVHRDIKPHNLMLTPTGDVKILDFGLAGIASELHTEELPQAGHTATTRTANHQLTQAGSMMGTPDYIAPEQATDAHAADIRADIYSLGCTFYTLLAGRPPFAPGSVFDKIKAHAEQTPRALAEYRADVPAEIEAILLRMLAKNPAERYQTPREVVAALEQSAPTAPKALPVAVSRNNSRSRFLAFATVASLFFAILAAVVFYIQTDNGLIRVEVVDESLQVKLNGRTIEMKDGQVPLTVQVGAPKLVVQRGDFKFETNSFRLRRGDKVTLQIDILQGEVVVLKDGQRFDAKPLADAGLPVMKGLKLQAELSGHTNVIRALQSLPSEQQIASVDGDGNVFIWSSKTHQQVRRFRIPGGAWSDADLSTDGRLLAIASDWGPTKSRLEIWDLVKEQRLHQLTQDLTFIEQMRLSPDGSKLLLVGTPPVALVYDVTLGKQLHKIDSGLAQDQQLKSGRFTPQGDAVVIGSVKRVQRFSVETGLVLSDLELMSNRIVTELLFTPDQQRLAVIQPGAWGALIDAKSWRFDQRLRYAAVDEKTRNAVFANDDQLITGSDLGAIRLQTLSGSSQAVADCGIGGCLHMSLDLAAAQLVTGGGWYYDGTTSKWTTTGDYKLRIWQLPASPLMTPSPLTIGMNEELGMLFEGRLVAPAELSRRLEEALKENPDRAVAIDLPKKPWTVAAHVDQLEQIARIVGAKRIIRPEWSGSGSLPLPEIVFVRKLEGHTGAIKSVAYSPDGTLIASASGFPHSDGTIRLWDVKQAKESLQLKGQQGLTQSLCFSHDGKQLLAGGSDKKLRLWDVATGELLKTIAGHEGSIESVAFSPNDRIAVSGSVAAGGSTDHTVVLWDLATGKEIARFTGHKLHVHGVAIIDDTRAISVDRMGVGYIWRTDNGQQLKRLAVPSNASNSAYALALSPDRTKAIIGYQDNAIRIWDVNSGEVIQTLPSQNSPTMSVCMTADQRFVLAGGGAMGDKSVALEIFELASGKRVASTEPIDGTTWSIALSPDGRHVVAAGGAKWKSEEGFVPSDDYALYVWQLPESLWPQLSKITLLRELPGSKEWITAVAYPENDLAVTVAIDGVVRVWKNGGAELDSHQLPFGGMADISPNGKSILIASAHDGHNSTVALWDVDAWKERWRITFPVQIAEGALGKLAPKHIVHAQFAPHGRVVVRSNVEAGVAIVDAATGEILSRFPEKGPAMGAASLSPDGKRLFVRQMAPAPFGRIYRIEDGAELAQIDTRDVVLDAVWSRDGAQLILAESTLTEGRIAVFNASTGELIRRWIAEPKGIESLALGQGNLLATGGLTRIALWNWSTGKLLAAVESPKQDGSARLAIAISPDGKRLISGGARWLAGEDRLPRLWQLPESVAATTIASNRLLVELKDDGQFQIEGRTVNSVELHNRLQWVLKETPEREVHVLPAKKFSGEPFRNLVDLVRSAGGKRITWPKEVDEALLQEMTGPELDPAVSDAVNDLAAVFEKYLRNIKATSACVGEFPGNLPERIGKPLRTGVEQKLRVAGFEIVPATPAPKGVFELSGVSYEVQIYKKLPKLDVRYRIGRSGVGAHQGGGGHITTYGRKMEASDLLGDWTETNDPQRGPVHTLRFLKNGEFHEAGPMAISIAGGAKQWVTKDLDGDGKPDIVPFQMSGSWEWKDGELYTETTSSNVLGFKNERPGNQRRFRIETLTKDKLVLVLLENGTEVDRFTAFRPTAKGNSAPPENPPAGSQTTEAKP